jgi:hypothetical protein
LGPCGSDDDLGSHRSDPNLHSGITVLGKFTGQDLIKLGEEDSISDELKPKTKASEKIMTAKEGVIFCFTCAFLANFFPGRQTESERKS